MFSVFYVLYPLPGEISDDLFFGLVFIGMFFLN